MTGSKKICYRVTKDACHSDSDIFPSGHSSSVDTEIGRRIEGVLETVRSANFPSKPARLDTLFIFADERCALRYWLRMKNGRVYAVEIEETDILHRGDMMLLHDMETILQSGNDATLVAQKYWRGDSGENHCEELLVRKAKVIEDVSPKEEKDVIFRKLYRTN
jgi:hypothetical protein